MRRALIPCAALIISGGCGDSTGPTSEEICTAADATGTIDFGQTRTETLSMDDCVLPNDSPGDGWQLTITATTVVQVDLTSDQFDAFVAITDDDLVLVAAADDTGEGTNASLITSLAPGNYIVWATSFAAEAGAYQLTVGPARTPTCVVEEPTGAIAVGETIQGELDVADCLMVNGAVAERWQLVIDATQTVRIDLRSTAFDAYLYISDPDGVFIAADDDGGDGADLNSRIQLTLDPGTYLLWASSFDAEMGAFDLAVAPAAPAANP